MNIKILNKCRTTRNSLRSNLGVIFDNVFVSFRIGNFILKELKEAENIICQPTYLLPSFTPNLGAKRLVNKNSETSLGDGRA